jgi:M6 family metalloprotease-like protein
MKTNFHVLILLCIGVAFSQHVSAQNCHGITAAHYPVLYVQPDGSKLMVQGTGNGDLHYMQTIDEYTLLANENGYLEYAELGPDGHLRPTGIIAHDPEQRSDDEIYLLSQMRPNTFDSRAVRQQKRLLAMDKEIHQAHRAAFPTTGTRRVLVLLIQYPDLMATNTRDEFDDFMNEADFNGTGSFRDYFLESSFNQLTLNTDVFGWYTAANNSAYYADDNGNIVARELGREAIDAAEAAGVDFSPYDNDGDGNLDGIIFVHAGPGAEEGSLSSLYIWSHRSRLSNDSYDVTYDGVHIDDYMINPERRNSNTTMVGIGVFCHEFGHGLGLPDLYDTDDSNGDSEGIGWWGIMGSGGWAGGENLPINFGAWEKIRLGWQTATDITGQVAGFQLSPASLVNNEVYRLNTADPNEYFLLENRQNVGLDISIPGHGMIIWHIDDNQTTNSDENQKWVDVEEAEGTSDLDNNINRGDSDDPFPGTDNNKIFNDTSNPNSTRYNGDDTGTDINNIREEGDLVLFNMGCEPANAICRAFANLYLDQNGQASLSVLDVDNGSTFDCGFLSSSISQTSFTCADLGFNLVTLNVEDVNGNEDECDINVYVHDQIAPTLTVPADIAVPCSYSPTTPDATGQATAIDNCDLSPDISYADAEIIWEDLSREITRTWTAIDDEGNWSTGVQVITVPSPITLDAGSDQTVYVDFVGIEGYSYSACADLSALAFGGTAPYTYEWSDGQVGQDVEVCPDVCTQYFVTITDANGCVTKDSLIVYAVIVECMNGNNQNLSYLLCHEGKTICTSFSSTETHLDNGDGLGACGDIGDQGCEDILPYNGLPIEFPEYTDAQHEPEFRLMPNPVNDLVEVQVTLAQPTKLEMSLHDLQGRKLYVYGNHDLSRGFHGISLSVAQFQAGSYLLQVSDHEHVNYIQNLIVLR